MARGTGSDIPVAELGNLAAAKAPTVIDAGGHSSIQVPGGTFLLDAQYERHGNDLELVGADGSRVLIHDYFRTDHPPALTNGAGATISPELATTLAGPRAAGQFAQVNGGSGLIEIGFVDKLTGTVKVRHADGTVTTLAKGQPVYKGDVLETSDGGGVGLVFADRSTFSLGSKGRMTLDDLVYDPNTKEGSSTMSVVKGAFSFVSGQTAKIGPDAAVIKTPVMTIGIRGTSASGEVSETGQTEIVLIPDPDGRIGE